MWAEQEVSQETVAVIQAKEDSGSDQGDENRWDSGYILKVEPTGFAIGLDVGNEKGRSQWVIQGFRFLQLEKEKPLTGKGENWGGEVSIILLKKELKIK